MNRFICKSLLLAAVSLSLAACSKDDGKPSPDDEGLTSLSGLSFEEVLQKKYDRVELVCSLRVQKGPQLDLNAGPSDMAILDLKTSSHRPLQMKLSGNVQGHAMTAEIEIKKLDILSYFIYREECKTCTDGAFREYRLKYTPYAEISARLNWTTSVASGVGTDGGRITNQIVNERILNPVHNSSVKLGDQELSVFDYLVCTLQTDIRHEYHGQFESKIVRDSF